MSLRENGRQRYWRQVREIEERLDLSHHDARRRWREYYRPGGRQIRPLRQLELSIRAATSEFQFCPFCRDTIQEDEGDYTCPQCSAHYHDDCFEEELGGACATLGCASRAAIRQVRVRARPRTTADYPHDGWFSLRNPPLPMAIFWIVTELVIFGAIIRWLATSV